MDEINSIWHKIAIDKAERIASYKADPQKAIEQIEWGEYECEGGTIETDLAWVAIKELLAEPSDADVAEAIDYFEDVIPYMAECDGEKHYKTALDCMRQYQYQKPTDEAVQRAIEWAAQEEKSAIEDQHFSKAYHLDVIQTALRQMRSEPCGKCHALYAVRTYRDGKDLGYIDIMTKYCPNCGEGW